MNEKRMDDWVEKLFSELQLHLVIYWASFIIISSRYSCFVRAVCATHSLKFTRNYESWWACGKRFPAAHGAKATAPLSTHPKPTSFCFAFVFLLLSFQRLERHFADKWAKNTQSLMGRSPLGYLGFILINWVSLRCLHSDVGGDDKNHFNPNLFFPVSTSFACFAFSTFSNFQSDEYEAEIQTTRRHLNIETWLSSRCSLCAEIPFAW